MTMTKITTMSEWIGGTIRYSYHQSNSKELRVLTHQPNPTPPCAQHISPNRDVKTGDRASIRASNPSSAKCSTRALHSAIIKNSYCDIEIGWIKTKIRNLKNVIHQTGWMPQQKDISDIGMLRNLRQNQSPVGTARNGGSRQYVWYSASQVSQMSKLAWSSSLPQDRHPVP